jgi:hypothetical protein
MRQLQITKTKHGFAYKDRSMNGNWMDLPRSITTKEGIEDYFMQGKDRRLQGQYDKPQLMFTDQSGKPVKHYAINFEADGSAMATTDFDTKKKLYMVPHSLWSETDRLAWLRAAAIHLPEEIDKATEAVKYLSANEPMTIEDYQIELKDRSRIAAEQQCHQHAQEFFPGTSSIVEFQ